MLIYRIGPTIYADDLLGTGPKINGGRWNNIGTPCIYCSATRALALLEYTCHVKKHLVLRDLSFVTYEVPDHSIKIYPIAKLPGNWKHLPHAKESQDFGSHFLNENQFLLYELPSVVIEEEKNYIINPSHPDMKLVKISDISSYAYDLRIKTN